MSLFVGSPQWWQIGSKLDESGIFFRWDFSTFWFGKPQCKIPGTHLVSKRHKLRVVCLVVIIQRTFVLRVRDEPVDGGKVFPLGQLLVQPPEHLHDVQCRRGDRVWEITTRGRHSVETFSLVRFNGTVKSIRPFWCQGSVRSDVLSGNHKTICCPL